MAAQTYEIVGDTYASRGQSTTAIEKYKIVLKLSKTMKDEYKSQLRLGRIMNEIGWKLLLKKDYESAIENFQKAIDLGESEREKIIAQCKKNLGFSSSVSHESLIKSFAKKIDEATYEKEKLIAIYKKNLGYCQSLIYFMDVKTKDSKDAQMIQNGLDNLEKARTTLKKLKRNSDIFDASLKLGNIHRRLEQYEEALDEYNIGKQCLQEIASTSLCPKIASVENNIAYCLYKKNKKKGSYDEVEEEIMKKYEEVLKIHKELNNSVGKATVQYNIGKFQIKNKKTKNDYEKSLTKATECMYEALALQKIVNLGKNDLKIAKTYRQLGLIYKERYKRANGSGPNLLQRAKQHLQKANEILEKHKGEITTKKAEKYKKDLDNVDK